MEQSEEAVPATPEYHVLALKRCWRMARWSQPFGKEDTAVESQSHADRTQVTLVNAVENAEVTEIKCAVFRAFDTSQSYRDERIRYDCPT